VGYSRISGYDNDISCYAIYSNSDIDSYVFRPLFYLDEFHVFRLYYVYFKILDFKVEVRITVFDDDELDSSMRFNFVGCVDPYPYWIHIDFECEVGLSNHLTNCSFIELRRVNDNLEFVFEL
jgi:hypothetical protein